MKKDGDLVSFQNRKIRRIYDEKEEKWYFSVIDVISVLTDSFKPRVYWNAMKTRVKSQDGIELSTFCRQLKLEALDGKKYQTDCSDVEGLFRIIQSIPSPKAEPFKQWLAKVGYERVQEISDPEKALNRSREYWKRLGRSDKWIQQRMMGQEIRNKLTDYWKGHEIKEGEEYAILTNIIHREWSDFTVKEHKSLKGLKTENLRDHMSDAELVFTALAELSTRQIAETEKAIGMVPNEIAGKKGGRIAKRARLDLEQKTGKSVVSAQNFLPQKIKKMKVKVLE